VGPQDPARRGQAAHQPDLFDSYGSKVVFFGRFVSILRTYAAFLAGMSRMQLLRLLDRQHRRRRRVGRIFTYLSYVAGNTLRRTSGTITWVLVGVALVVIGTVIVLARHRWTSSPLVPTPLRRGSPLRRTDNWRLTTWSVAG